MILVLIMKAKLFLSQKLMLNYMMNFTLKQLVIVQCSHVCIEEFLNFDITSNISDEILEKATQSLSYYDKVDNVNENIKNTNDFCSVKKETIKLNDNLVDFAMKNTYQSK